MRADAVRARARARCQDARDDDDEMTTRVCRSVESERTGQRYGLRAAVCVPCATRTGIAPGAHAPDG